MKDRKKEKLRFSRMSRYERELWKEGLSLIAGVDEAGRGPLAGPVVAAAVILPKDTFLPGLDDSKKLSAARREILAPRIREKALDWAIGQASVDEIDAMNILRATFLAMQRAVNGLKTKPEFVLIDGRDNPLLVYGEHTQKLPSQALIKGDTLSLSIAAASIIAKVYRDDLMVHYSEAYPQYGFE